MHYAVAAKQRAAVDETANLPSGTFEPIIEALIIGI
jgi:hypothetical protein